MARTKGKPGPKPKFGEREEIHVRVPVDDMQYIRSVTDNVTEWVAEAIQEKREREPATTEDVDYSLLEEAVIYFYKASETSPKAAEYRRAIRDYFIEPLMEHLLKRKKLDISKRIDDPRPPLLKIDL